MANIITKKQVGLLQTAKTKLGLSEEDYRSLLYKYGVDSTKELTQPAFKHLLKTFQRLGFEMQGRSTAAQLRHIAKMQADMAYQMQVSAACAKKLWENPIQKRLANARKSSKR